MNLIITVAQIILYFLFMSFLGIGYSNYILLSILCLSIFAGCFYCFLKYKNYILYKISSWNTKIYSIIESFYILFEKPKTVFFVFVNLLLHVILGSIRFSCIFMILGLKDPWICGGLYYGLYIASTIVPVLPGNIGISEILVGIANSLLGSAFDAGITAVLIERIYYYFVSFAGAMIAACLLWIRWEKKSND